MTVKASKAIQQITEQRQALESLIRIAQGVHNQQSALSELALAARPSQDFPKSVLNYFAAVEKKMADTPIPEVLKKIEAIESVTERDLSQIIYLATLDVHALRANQIESAQLENIDVAYFTDAINNFKRRTQTALAMRVLLKKRGVAIQPFKLSVSQETLNQKIQDLKQKEIQCIQQIRLEINQIIDDTSLLLEQDSFSEEMKQSLRAVRRAMKINLRHLDEGGSVNDIPNVFEIVTLESGPSSEFPLSKDPDTHNVVTEESSGKIPIQPVKDKSATAKQKPTIKQSQPPPAKKQVPRSYWWIFKLWVTSPWKTSWRSLVNKYRP